MNHSKYILLYIVFLLIGSWVNAQTHRINPPTNCKFAKVQATSNFINCEVCYNNDEQENKFNEKLAEKRAYERTKIGALAIDRSNGFYYGFSYDYETRAEAEKKALQECEKKGGNCTIVLVFQGEACAAYRTVATQDGTAYGWGVASTKEEADRIAYSECLKRSNGASPGNFVWSCNSKSAEPAKTIYKAGDALPSVNRKNKLNSVNSAQLSGDGQYLTITQSNAIQIYEVPSLRLVFDEAYENFDGNESSYRRLHGAALSPDYKYLYVSESSGVFKVDLKTKKTIQKFPASLSNSKVEITSDGNKLVVINAYTKEFNYVLNASNLSIVGKISNTHNGFNFVTISPNNKIAALSAVMGYISFINLETGREIRKVQIGGNVQGGKFSLDNTKFVIATFSEQEHPNPTADYTRVIEVSNGNIIKKYNMLKSLGKNAAFLDNDRKIIECNYGNECNILDYESGRILQSIDVQNNWTFNVSNAGKTFVTTGIYGLKSYSMNSAGKFILVNQIKAD